MSKVTLVTAALPYANGSLHLGHMVEYVQADVFARFLRLSGNSVVFACADDTHGAPIELAASKAGIRPEELIARYHDEHQQDFSDFLISFDVYHSTHSDENRSYSDFFFRTLKGNGYIYERLVEQTYCERDRRFLPDRFVRGECPRCSAPDQYGDQCERCNSVYKPVELVNPYCVICKTPPVRKTSLHYFFRLSSFSNKLRKWISDNPRMQPEIRNFVFSWIDRGLEDWDITRDGPYFGFKIPGEVSKYYYVWLDAPIGYVSASEVYARQHLGRDASFFWKSESSEIVHFIGKDIIYFHLLFWPAMLMGVGYNLPSDIVVHGHLTINNEKMSKSRGNFLTVRDYLEHFEPELLRFYYASSLSRTSSDLNLDLDDFKNRVNSELVSNVSNFIYRTLNFVNKNFDSRLGRVSGSADDKLLAARIQSKCDEAIRRYAGYNFREAVRAILEVSSLGNRYLQDNAPWKLVKADRKRCHEVLTLAANIVKNLSILLFPVVPSFSLKVQKQLSLEGLSFSDINFSLSNRRIGTARIIFTNIEELPKLGAELFPACLKVGQVESVGDHPDADRLYVLKVSLGSEVRQLVAGLKSHFTREELLNRKIIVVANLKPAMLRGVESRGMLLAAEKNGKLVLLAAPKAEVGEVVFAEGLDSSDVEIGIDRFYSLGLSVEGKCVFYGERALMTKKGGVVAPIDDGAVIR